MRKFWPKPHRTVLRNLEEVAKTNEFKAWTEDRFVEVISDDSLLVESEDA